MAALNFRLFRHNECYNQKVLQLRNTFYYYYANHQRHYGHHQYLFVMCHQTNSL